MSTLEKQVTEFYKFIGDIIQIHRLNPDIGEEPNESVKLLEEQLYSNDDENNIKIKEMTPLLNKILYKLYSDKGIKRKLVGNLVQLFYDKSHPSYDKNDAVTQLCRHLVIDPRNLRIVSMGVTKACDYETFKEQTEFRDAIFEEFPDGTMCVYTPELSSYQHDTHIDEPVMMESTEDASNEQSVPAEDAKPMRRVKDFKCSTRKVLGTGFFDDPKMSFHDMFRENNSNSGLDLDKLPAEYNMNHSFVFNVQHSGNRVVTPIEKGKGVNTLCAVFKFKSNEQVDREWNDMVSSLHDNPDTFDDKFKQFYSGMVEQLDLTKFVEDMSAKGFPFTAVKNITPDVLRHFNDYDSFEKFIDGNPYEYQGVVIKTPSGIRTKYRNDQYNMVKELKGSLPIMAEERNNKNLFEIYWRLRQKQDGSLTKFCKYFGKDVYSKLFNFYNMHVYELTRNLHGFYLAAFVNKTMQKPDIPFEYKPLCGDLHKLYIESRNPVTLNVVITYINNSPVGKIYWRIFGLPEDQMINQVDATGEGQNDQGSAAAPAADVALTVDSGANAQT